MKSSRSCYGRSSKHAAGGEFSERAQDEQKWVSKQQVMVAAATQTIPTPQPRTYSEGGIQTEKETEELPAEATQTTHLEGEIRGEDKHDSEYESAGRVEVQGTTDICRGCNPATTSAKGIISKKPRRKDREWREKTKVIGSVHAQCSTTI